MFRLIKKRKIWYSVSITLLVISVLSLLFLGLKPGIDFTGGSLLEIKFQAERPDANNFKSFLNEKNIQYSSIQPAGDNEYIIRAKPLSEDEHANIFQTIKENYPDTEETRFESIGPTIGNELKNKSYIAITLVLVCIILYIAYAFRKISGEISSWKFAVTAIITLCHDMVITIGIFSIIAFFLNIEIDTLFITALLTVLGYSVNDTIVVFDRIRHNLLKHPNREFENNVETSVNQTLTRSINTSATTLIVLLILFIFGGQTIQWFVLTLILGVIVGTYSSIFIASPILTTWEKYTKKKK